MAIATVIPASLAAQTTPEQALKAAFIYNFAVFTEWPAAALPPDASLSLCIHPGSPLGAALADLNMPTIRGRQVLIRPSNKMLNLRSCHILLLGMLDRSEWRSIKQALRGGNVLTITDIAEPAPGDAIISLSVSNKHIAFDIDLTAAHQAQLTLSSKLLRLARNVQ